MYLHLFSSSSGKKSAALRAAKIDRRATGASALSRFSCRDYVLTEGSGSFELSRIGPDNVFDPMFVVLLLMGSCAQPEGLTIQESG